MDYQNGNLGLQKSPENLSTYYANSEFTGYLIKNKFFQSYKSHFNNILCEIQLCPVLLLGAITDTSSKSI